MEGGDRAMKRRGQVTTLQERREILERAKQGVSDAAIAADLGCSAWTVRKWRRIGQRGDLARKRPIGRPGVGPLGTSSLLLQETVRQLRRDHPGWGPLTILAALAVDPARTETVLPSRAPQPCSGCRLSQSRRLHEAVSAA